MPKMIKCKQKSLSMFSYKGLYKQKGPFSRCHLGEIVSHLNPDTQIAHKII